MTALVSGFLSKFMLYNERVNSRTKGASIKQGLILAFLANTILIYLNCTSIRLKQTNHTKTLVRLLN